MDNKRIFGLNLHFVFLLFINGVEAFSMAVVFVTHCVFGGICWMADGCARAASEKSRCNYTSSTMK